MPKQWATESNGKKFAGINTLNQPLNEEETRLTVCCHISLMDEMETTLLILITSGVRKYKVWPECSVSVRTFHSLLYRLSSTAQYKASAKVKWGIFFLFSSMVEFLLFLPALIFFVTSAFSNFTNTNLIISKQNYLFFLLLALFHLHQRLHSREILSCLLSSWAHA